MSDAEIKLLQRARGPAAKTAMCSLWLQEFISREFQHGALGKTAPPIVSRLYQFVSDGTLGYHQARKVAYVPFPFAHARKYSEVLKLDSTLVFLSTLSKLRRNPYSRCLFTHRVDDVLRCYRHLLFASFNVNICH